MVKYWVVYDWVLARRVVHAKIGSKLINMISGRELDFKEVMCNG